MISPFADNATYLITRSTATGDSEHLGYVFAGCGSSPLVDQEQRWILYNSYSTLLSNIKVEGDSMRFREPALPQRYTSLGAWMDALRSGALWQTGATYVKVNAKNYTAVPNPIEPPPFPLPPSSSPSLTPGSPGNPGQLIDDTVAAIYRIGDGGGATLQGYAGGGVIAPVSDSHIKMSTNVEYWVSRDHYVNLLGAGVSRLRFDLSWTPGKALSIVRSEWTPGSTFTVASCVYFPGLPESL